MALRSPPGNGDNVVLSRSWIARAACVAAIAAAVPGAAAETVTYAYDARGRLVEVKRTTSGSSAPAPSTTNYQFDKANNRTVKSTSSP